MINRFTLVAIAAAVVLSGCAKHSVDENVADFSSGATLLSVTHLPARTADGATVFITVDGNEAGALPVGESMALRVPAGAHQVGGYARSLIGRVTIPAVKVTTSPDTTRYVAYTVTRSKPLFTELSEDPNQKSSSAAEEVPAETAKTSAPVKAAQPVQISETARIPEPAQSPETVPKAEPAPAAEVVKKPEIAQVTDAAQTPATAPIADTAKTDETVPATISAPATETTQTKAAPESSETSQLPETAKTSQKEPESEAPQS